MFFHAESPCRSHVELTGDLQVYFGHRGFVEAFPASSHGHFLSSLFSFSLCWITVRDILPQMLISQQERHRVDAVHFPVICPHMVMLFDPVSLQRAFGLSLSLATCYNVVFGPPCWLLSVRTETALWAFSSLLSLPRTFCLCCGCPPSSLSSVLALFGRQ